MKSISKLDECKLAYWLIKNGKKIKKFPYSSSDFIQYYQQKRLLEIVKDAYIHVPYYNKLYKQKGIDPFTFNSISDFKRLPTITKKDVLGNEKDFIDDRFRLGKLIESRTSGTSGAYLSVYCNVDMFLLEELQVIRMIKELYPSYSFNSKEVLVYTSKYPVSSILGFYKAFYINNLKGPKRILEFIIEKKPVVLAIYPSILLQIIKDNSNFDFRSLGIKLIIVNSEQSSAMLREYFKDCFGCIVIDEFSSEELQSISYQCKYGCYHEVSDCTYIEILDINSDTEVPIGSRGEITGTCLINKAMPLIRYRQGDYAINVAGRCLCGKKTRIIGSPEGRINDSFITPSGNTIPSGILLDWEYSLVLSGAYNIREYKLIQTTGNNIELYFDGIIPDSEQATSIIKDFRNKVSDEFNVSLMPWENLPQSTNSSPIQCLYMKKTI